MSKPIQLKRNLNRFIEIFLEGSPDIPQALYSTKQQAPDMSAITLPLPSKKSEYTCFAESRDGIVWYGATTGLTRYDPKAEYKQDQVQYFSAQRNLCDNNVKALWLETQTDEKDYEIIWVLTNEGVAKITMRWLTAEEKAEVLLAETLRVVDRRGMVSQRELSTPYRPDTAVPYNECDNDGCFGCGFAMAELMHYAVLKKTLGKNHPDTLRIKAVATRICEAMLLLLYIPGRGDGFPARTYLAPTEPIPGGGLFFRKRGDGTAEVVATRSTLTSGRAGEIVPCPNPVPARLAKLYEDEGYTEKGLVYKGDTSSDEVTLHVVHLYYLHLILGEDDPELDQLAIEAGRALVGHILDHGNELIDAFGQPTTWAKYSERYFEFGSLGWVDACLNSTELLMYLRVMMFIDPEQSRWQAAYDELLAKGYNKYGAKHAQRLDQMCLFLGNEPCEEIMYGDHMLATSAFWPLILLEPDEALKADYRAGYTSWRGSIGREYNAGYDMPYFLSCPDADIDWERLTRWFYRHPASRLAASVTIPDRHDMPTRVCRCTDEETGYLLTPDENHICKYDRNPNRLSHIEPNRTRLMESCYVYTFAYWFGRYYGMVE